ncbi:MAG TPA: GntP family permease [Cyclobacteriaceae bacterium]
MTSLLTIILALAVSVGAVIVLTRYFKLHAFFSLLIAAIICGLITGLSIVNIISLMQEGFGLLLRQIGFLVALGSVLGMMLEKTGAMEVMSRKLVSWFGAKRSTLALSVTGIIVGIPVFCDSGFIILSRLVPSIAAQTSVLPAELSLALASGLYTTHTLVPPTPGPLTAAVTLGLEDKIYVVMLIGIVASIPVGLVAYFFSKRLSKGIITRQEHEIKQTPGVNPWLAFLPLILPIVLIALGVNTVIALALGVGLSFIPIRKKDPWPSWTQEALKDAGVILLIVGAGGAFGMVIKASSLDHVLKNYVSDSSAQGVVFLLIAFTIAAALKTAQGSTTTSMILTSGLLVPLILSAGFDTTAELSALVVAIGGGAMVVSHANDAYFWVVSQFGGIAPKDAFRSYTIITALQGLTALLMSILIFLLL